MEKLKPCPFCMSDNIRALSVVGMREYGDPYYTLVKCSDCSASIVRGSDESTKHAHRAAVEAWNRRAHGGTAYMEGGDAERL